MFLKMRKVEVTHRELFNQQKPKEERQMVKQQTKGQPQVGMVAGGLSAGADRDLQPRLT